MTDIVYEEVISGTRLGEAATDTKIGARGFEIGAYGNSNVVIDGSAGFCPAGKQKGEINTDGAADEYVEEGGTPATFLGVRKIGEKAGPFEATFEYPEEFVRALATGETMSVVYPGSPINTTIDTGSGAISSTTIPVASGAAASYAAGIFLEIVCGSATYGTRSLFRRIKSISSDLITLAKPLPKYFLPANGAAVKKVKSVDFLRNTAEFSEVAVARKVIMDNANAAVNVEMFYKVQFVKGSYKEGEGKVPAMATLKFYCLGEYNSSSGHYDISKKRDIA